MRATSTFILWKLINVQESRYNQPRGGELDMAKKCPLVSQLMPKVSFSLLNILCDHNHSLFDFYFILLLLAVWISNTLFNNLWVLQWSLINTKDNLYLFDLFNLLKESLKKNLTKLPSPPFQIISKSLQQSICLGSIIAYTLCFPFFFFFNVESWETLWSCNGFYCRIQCPSCQICWEIRTSMHIEKLVFFIW